MFHDTGNLLSPEHFINIHKFLHISVSYSSGPGTDDCLFTNCFTVISVIKFVIVI